MTERTSTGQKTGYHHGDLRSALIAAADTLLEERGVEGFTLVECARRAGVSKAAPAHHFGNVRGLLGAIASQGIEDLADRMEGALAVAGPGASARLQAIGGAYVDFALDRPERFRLMFGPSSPTGLPERPSSASTDRALLILEREIASLRPERRLGRAMTVFTWSFVHGLSMLLLDHRLSMLVDDEQGEPDRDAMIAESVALLSFP